MSLTLRLSTWIRPDEKHSDCEIDLKFLDYSTRRRTELAEKSACPASAGSCVQAKTGQEVNQNSDFRQAGGSAGTEQTSGRFRETRFESDWRSETFRAIRDFTVRTGWCARAGLAAPEAAPLS
jgi:hypothetical protein